MDEKSRKESSISCQSRVSVVDLARLDWWWTKQGHHMRSMSQLINWSLMHMVDELVRQGHLGDDAIPTIASAHKYLNMRGLYQRSHLKRSGSRLAMAIKFESMRAAGLDTEREHPRAHRQIHNTHSIPSHSGPDHYEVIPQEEWDRIKKQNESDRLNDFESSRKQTLANAEESGIIVDHYSGPHKRIPGKGIRVGTRGEELDKYDKAREKNILAKENAPIDTSGMEFADEPDDK